MSITVKDILRLDILKGAEIAAGKDGLSREVMRVNFTDSPLDPDDPGYSLVSRGDLYIHSFYAHGDDEEQILALLNFYIQSGSSCCLGVRYRMQTLPEKALLLAEQNHYPIIMLDSNIPYGQLIKDISELILTEQLDLHSENKINRLLYETLSPAECAEILQYLVPDLPSRYLCAFAECPGLSALRLRLLKQDCFTQMKLQLLRYQKGGFLILNAEEHTDPAGILDSLTLLLDRYDKQFIIGVSSRCDGPGDFVRCFKEACSAHQISRLTGARITGYDDVSIYNLLLPLQNNAVLKNFCRETFGPIEEYGKRHNIDLVETVQIYLETNGNIKKAAQLLNTHENTVRFRLAKARDLLGLGDEPYAFIERMALALKAKRLL